MNTPVIPEFEIPKPNVAEKFIVSGLTALIVARPLIHSDDPGHLRLTSSIGSTWFDIAVWLLVVVYAIVGVIPSPQNITRRFSSSALFITILLLLMPILWKFNQPDAWVRFELSTITALFAVAVFSVFRHDNSRGLMNVILASAVSISAIGISQRFGPYIGVPSTEVKLTDTYPGLVGDEEFQSQLNAKTCATGLVHGTLETPESYLIFLLAFMPLSILLLKERGPKSKMALPILMIAGILAVFAGTIFDNHVPTSVSEAFRIITNQELSALGVGGAGFSRESRDGSLASGSAWLTMIACLGTYLPALILLFSIFGAIIVRRWVRHGDKSKASPPFDAVNNSLLAAHPHPKNESTRWEFYLGGIAGLLGGFLGSIGQMPAESPVWEVYNVGGFAIGRGIIWLAAFGILEKTTSQLSTIRTGATWALVVIGISGLFSEAAGFSSILFFVPMLIAITLRSEANVLIKAVKNVPIFQSLTFLLMTAFIFICFVIIYAAPAIQTSGAVRKARMASRLYPEIEHQIQLAKNPVERANARTRAINFLQGRIIKPLRDASESEPNNAALHLEIARWERTLWKQLLHVDTGEAAKLGKDILKTASKAASLDPKNIAGEQSILESLLLYRQESNSKPQERLEAFNKHLKIVVEKSPKLEVGYRYRMMSALLKAKDVSGIESEIVSLLRLNRVEGNPHGKMTDNQLKDLIDDSRALLHDPPKELLEEWTK